MAHLLGQGPEGSRLAARRVARAGRVARGCSSTSSSKHDPHRRASSPSWAHEGAAASARAGRAGLSSAIRKSVTGASGDRERRALRGAAARRREARRDDRRLRGRSMAHVPRGSGAGLMPRLGQERAPPAGFPSAASARRAGRSSRACASRRRLRHLGEHVRELAEARRRARGRRRSPMARAFVLAGQASVGVAAQRPVVAKVGRVGRSG